MSWAGHYLDGRSPQRRPARITLGRTALEIVTDDGTTRRWAFADIRQTQGSYAGEPVRLERGGAASEVLIVDDVAFLTALRESTPDLRRRFHDPRWRGLRINLTIAAVFGALAAAVVLYRWGIPAMAVVATHAVPVTWEVRLGDAVFERIFARDRRCQEAGRQRVIDGIMMTLLGARPAPPYRLTVAVVDRADINAVALPGGRIVIFRGLLELTDSAEMLAGVLAHEMQHVLRRHTTRAIIQHASTGLMVSALAGDVSGLVAFGLEGARVIGTLNYSRRAEEEADAEGLRMLRDARVDPAGLIAFFERVLRPADDARNPGAGLRYLSTHPATDERIAALRALAEQPGPAPVRLLPDYPWNDIKRICDGA